MSRYDLQFPLRQENPPHRTAQPWDEDTYDKTNAAMDPSWLPWGAARVMKLHRGVFEPVYPGQKPMRAEEPNFHGVHAFREKDEASPACNYWRPRWHGFIKEDTVPTEINQFEIDPNKLRM